MAHVIYSCIAGRFEDITYGVLYFVLWGLDIVLFVVKLSIYFQATFSSWTFIHVRNDGLFHFPKPRDIDVQPLESILSQFIFSIKQ